MSLEESFPEDPWLPSLRYAACSLLPFSLPWSTAPVKIGTGFNSKLAISENPFTAECAFDIRSLAAAKLRYHSDTGGAYSHAEISASSNAQDHMNFSLGASASVPIVKASGQAKFETHSMDNSDGIKSRLLSTLHAGYLKYDETPDFSIAARESLINMRMSRKEGLFEERFGDYYVAAIRIGAANGTELSAESSSHYSAEAKSYSLTVTVKVFCWSASTTKADSSAVECGSTSGMIKFNGFDTLALSQSNESGDDFKTHERVISEANKNLGMGKLLQGRLGEAMRRSTLFDGCVLSSEQVEGLFKYGLVYEIQLLPYAKLRDYISYSSRS